VRFVNDFYVSALGSGNTTGVGAGPIKITQKADTGLVYSMIAAGGNMSLVPHRMVPLNKELLLQAFVASEKSQTKRCTVRLRADCNHASALSIVKASAWASANNAEAACSWWGYLFDV
jgi:hypothetical protein